MSKKRLLWLGYGDIAKRTMPFLKQQDLSLFAVSRSQKPAETCTLINGDLSSPAFVEDLLHEMPEHIVITMTPSGRGVEAYADAYFNIAKSVTEACCRSSISPQQIIFVSSTSVYHQQDGAWVNELSPTQPNRDTAKVLLDAERVLLDSDLPVQCLRFSGIYGEGRSRLIQQVIDGKPIQDQWTNRIHSDDCARVIAFLIDCATKGRSLPSHILASDEEPVLSSEVKRWIAERMHLPENHLKLVERGEGAEKKETEQKETEQKGKRCDSSLLRSLGFEFTYPNFREGYAALVDAFGNQRV